jgi:hypothetical protein
MLRGMNNPYQPPDPQPGMAPSRTPFLLAGIGALAASAYWALYTGLVGLSVAGAGVSPVRMILPFVLIVLYAVRGFQIFKGDGRAATSILWLHGIGGIMAVINMASGDPMIIGLNALKLLIHIFGAVTAHLARKAAGL